MSNTPYIPYGSAPSYSQAIQTLERERNELLRKSGLTPANSSIDGRVVGINPNDGRKYIYDSKNNQWNRTFGGYKKIAKNKIRQKCANSLKKCRYSHYKNTAKRSRRRTNKKK